MATTKQEAEATERRLRPVYGGCGSSTHSLEPVFLFISLTDAIDNGQNKKVIQLVDKVLKKQPGLNCAKVSLSVRHCWLVCITLLFYFLCRVVSGNGGFFSIGLESHRSVKTRASRGRRGIG